MKFNYYYLNNEANKKNVLGLKKLGVMQREIKPLSKDVKKPLTILGDGYNHYQTYFINKNLGIKSDVILFDYHSDYCSPNEGLGCSSWAGYYLKEFGSKILNIGKSKEDLRFFPKNYLMSSPKTLEDDLKKLSEEVYVSIDLDAIVYQKIGKHYLPEISNPENWLNFEAEGLRFGSLLKCLKLVKDSKEIIGADICGHKDTFGHNKYGAEGTLTAMALIINVFTKEADEKELMKNFYKNHEGIAGFFEFKKIMQFNSWLKKQEIL